MKGGASPVVSVVIPTHRSPDLTVRAIRSALAQDRGDLEIIVVVDGAPQMVNLLRRQVSGTATRVLSSVAPLGAAGARNLGVREATSDLVSFLDSDDVWLPNMVSTQLQCMAGTPGVVGVSTGYWLEGAGGVERRAGRSESQLLRELARGCALAPGSTLCVRRTAWLDVGGEDTSFSRLEDWDLLLRLALGGAELAHCNEPLALVTRSKKGPDPSHVERSCLLLMERHLPRMYGISPSLGRRFRATCLYEIALARFRHRDVIGAAFPAIGSTLLDPVPRARAARRSLKRLTAPYRSR